MKHINELTEQEILELTNEDILNMIKLHKAEEGIKFIDYPQKPTYYDVQKPTTKVYYCHLLGQKMSFSDMEELKSVLEVLSNCKTLCSVDSNYELPEGYKYYMKSKIENASYSSDAPDTIVPISAYTHKEYIEIKDMLDENSKNRKEYELKLKEYESYINDAKWIEDEINNRIREVNEKYYTLNLHCHRFKNDYMPLANNDQIVAMNFMDKAYNLTDEQKEFILSDYKKDIIN